MKPKIEFAFLILIFCVLSCLSGCITFSSGDFFGPVKNQPCCLPHKDSIPSTLPAEIKLQIEKLYSTEPIERAYAAIALKKQGEAAGEAVPFLIGILNDETTLSPVLFTNDLVESTSSLDIFNIDTSPGEEAAKALVAIGRPSVDPLIIVLLKQYSTLKNWEVYTIKNRSVNVLGEIGDNRAVEPLIAALDNRQTRSSSAEALGKFNDKRAIVPLQKYVKDKNTRVRINTISSLYNLMDKNDDQLSKILISATKDKSSTVRKISIEKLCSLLSKNDERLLNILIRASKDKEKKIYEYALRQLGTINHAKAYDAITKALKSKKPDVKIEAINVVRRNHIKNTEVIEILINTLKSQDNFSLYKEVQRTLKIITRNYSAETFDEWEAWWEENKNSFR